MDDVVGCEEELEEEEPEIDEPATPVLPSSSDDEESSYVPNEEDAARYFNMFQATLEILKTMSLKFSKECGGVSEMYAKGKTENPLPICPFWILTFMSCKTEVMTTRALEDVPLRTRSILGDTDLNSKRRRCGHGFENW